MEKSLRQALVREMLPDAPVLILIDELVIYNDNVRALRILTEAVQ